MVMPLEGVRVLDLSRVLSGPYCTMLLGDMGADVIKIEEPTRGDEQRTMIVYRRPEDEDFFYPMNRNKRSVAVNLKSEQGRQIVYDLAARSDIAVENFSPGVVARLGIDYGRLQESNPSLVYCSISGFGQFGPHRDRKAYDTIIQAMSGVMSATGTEDGPPTRFGLMAADISSALIAYSAILLALFHRERTGEGQYIDIAMLDSLISLWATAGAEYLATGKVPERFGNQVKQRAPANAFMAGDGRYVHIMANTPKLWTRLCELLEMPGLASDPRFDTMARRLENRKEVNAILQEKLKERTVGEWVSLLGDGGIPCGPVNNLDEVFADPHVRAREMLQTIEHPVSGTIRQIGIPQKLTRTPGSIRMPPPLLGQHTRDVLAGLLGYDEARIAGLERAGVVRCHDAHAETSPATL